ncbi:MAG: OprO/OprP family phosphate-selective porin [Thiohalocapsa sp.]|nr:OprO/OprP family phosphate-selective porin [Thiohalocapsa sp.]MCF7989948.1 OprO/OprP family phosphate-selective porin [Thiohalocapsa sp.]
MSVRAIPIVALLLGWLGSADAAESYWERIQIHGFASQALVYTSDNRWFGDSPDTSFDFTEIGLNASLRLHPRLLFSGQALFRRAGEMSDGDIALDYGLADISLHSSAEGRLGVRLGRIKNPLGLYNETRDVPFTHPGIFLPQVVYFDRVRNLVLSMDGAMLYSELYRPFGNLSLTLGAGKPVLDKNVEWAYLNGDFPGKMKPDGNSWLASLWYTTASERLKLGLSGATLSIEFDPDRRAPLTLDAGGLEFVYWIASAQYNTEQWTLTAEYAREPIQWRGFGYPIPDRDATGEGYYLQGTYRLRPDLELMLRYEEGYADVDDRDGRGLERETGGLLPANAGFSKILTAGLRWDINAHWMLRAEYAYNNGTFILSTRENPPPDDRARYWHLLSVQAAFRF